ncbi:hypothetical protein J3A83DRAFT_4044576, partial [Scleroderma citrinum]
ETADWLCSPDGAKAFTSKFGSNVELVIRPFPILVEFVPIHLNTNDLSALREIEHKNALLTGTIKSARWIKPIKWRSPLQWKAHLTLEILKPSDANQAIKNSLIVLEPCCSIHKLLPEPTWCMKCQSFKGLHFTKECKKLDDTCGTCTGNYRIKECEAISLDQCYCANCKEARHAAWDCECLIYLEK